MASPNGEVGHTKEFLKMPSASAEGGCKKELMINNVLCYISTARDCMKADDIVRVCLGFFKSEDIVGAKDLLCDIAGEKGKRRRNENRLLHELQDILNLLERCDDGDVMLPKFVADSYNALPPTSGFEIIASQIVSLMEEISSLRTEVAALKDARLNDNSVRQENAIIQEDVLEIKGELRKLNHKIIGDHIRRDSLILASVENSLLPSSSSCNKYNDNKTPSDKPAVISKTVEVTSVSPSAPPFSLQPEDELLERLLNDDGGSPSAPSYSQVCKTQQDKSSDQVRDVPKQRSNINKGTKNDDVSDDGFILVQNKKQRNNSRMRIVGNSGRASTLLKSAPRSIDLYIGNCDTDVTVVMLTQYISDVIDVTVKNCEQLITKYDSYSSFKITVLINDKDKLLSANVWPDDVVCRKYFHPRKTQK